MSDKNITDLNAQRIRARLDRSLADIAAASGLRVDVIEDHETWLVVRCHDPADRGIGAESFEMVVDPFNVVIPAIDEYRRMRQAPP